ncbi:hypothetical protein [Klebsiella variicola]|uniref:hypothetical protein n=1 Tax=Klebsiella variicola TaxID=244366 RepID=UPI001D11C711|nr:hypothetical protein [Klebsiella variicola]
MATTDTQQTAQFAAEASVSAAEAKQYLIEVQQGYQDISATTQEAINAATAAEAAKNAAQTAEQSAATSAEASSEAGSAAAISAAQAEQYASDASEYALNKFTFYKTPSDPDGTIAGLAATTSGQSFRVAEGPESTAAFKTYENQDGVAVLQASQPGTAAVTGTIREYPTFLAAQNDANAGNILNGAKCWIANSANSTLADEYINSSGTLTATGRQQPSKYAVDAISYLVSNATEEGDFFRILDILGFVLFRAKNSGAFGTKAAMINPDSISLSALSISLTNNTGLRLMDSFGFYIDVVDKNGVVAPRAMQVARDGSFATSLLALKKNDLSLTDFRLQSTDSAWLSIADKFGFYKTIIDKDGNLVNSGGGGDGDVPAIDVRDNANKAYWEKVRSKYNAAIQRPVANLNHIVWYGQSLASNQEGWPALSKVAKALYDNLMLGDSCRPNSRTDPTFTPLGTAVLNPLKAVVQTSDGSALMSDAEVAALPRGSVNEGEGAVACVNFFRKLWLQSQGLMQDSNRRLVLSNCAVNGRTIEQLSKGASPELYNRVREAISRVKTIASSQSLTYRVAAFTWLQGEWNYGTGYGGNDTLAGYKALLAQLYSDLLADFCSYQDPAALFMYQTSGKYTNDNKNLAIGMAQLQFSLENENCYMVAPSYPYPDKDGHLDPNGYRWQDMQFAKVMHRVLNLGEGWEPLHCRNATLTDNVALLDYVVPAPPLQWGKPFVILVQTDYADKGYRATDLTGDLPITSVEIVADTVVQITFGRSPVKPVNIWYADKTVHNGNGCLMDSDEFQSSENYEYNAGTGQYSEANISSMVNKPYPLNNWAVAQYITIA